MAKEFSGCVVIDVPLADLHTKLAIVETIFGSERSFIPAVVIAYNRLANLKTSVGMIFEAFVADPVIAPARFNCDQSVYEGANLDLRRWRHRHTCVRLRFRNELQQIRNHEHPDKQCKELN